MLLINAVNWDCLLLFTQQYLEWHFKKLMYLTIYMYISLKCFIIFLNLIVLLYVSTSCFSLAVNLETWNALLVKVCLLSSPLF